jgi:hypothetical protein
VKSILSCFFPFEFLVCTTAATGAGTAAARICREGDDASSGSTGFWWGPSDEGRHATDAAATTAFPGLLTHSHGKPKGWISETVISDHETRENSAA